MTTKTAVTVMGMGSMGSALARALLVRGDKVTVWNRTPERTAALASLGAAVASSASEAIAASPLVLMCVLDYASADAILAVPGVAPLLAGKTFIQYSTGAPASASAQQAVVHRHGGRFVAGGILAYPRSIGRPNCLILYAGDSSFEAHRETLQGLAGISHYLGTDPVSAVGGYFSLGTMLISSLVLYLETAALSRHYGIGIDTHYLLTRVLLDEILQGIQDASLRIATANFDGKLASIDLTITAMQEICATLKETGMPVKMTEGMVEALKLAGGGITGEDDIARLTETIWSHRRP